MNILQITTIFILLVVNFTKSAELDSVSDDDLVRLFKKETYLVVLFSKANCESCNKLEGLLFNLKEELKDNLLADVVKAFNSQLVRLYNPTKEPAIVFFRHGVPLLYHGPESEETILDTFLQNKDPIVKELTDDVFEHLTQASTGSTTGDWLVMFYTQECVDCQRLQAVWEAVGAALKRRLNVARINRGTVGVGTAKRFKIKKSPEIIFIRQGKFYRYEINKYDVQSLISFVQEWYKNSTPEKINPPPTQFDDLVSIGVEILKKIVALGITVTNDHPFVLVVAGIGFALVLITAIISRLRASKKEKEEKTTNSKKKAK